MMPGETLLTLIPSEATSSDSLQANVTIAPLVAAPQQPEIVEITVHPDWALTHELALAIAISAPWLGTYFAFEGGA